MGRALLSQHLLQDGPGEVRQGGHAAGQVPARSKDLT
jgi:hypothetical protein